MPAQNSLPPRENKPIMNLDAVEQTPVSEVNFDGSGTGYFSIIETTGKTALSTFFTEI